MKKQWKYSLLLALIILIQCACFVYIGNFKRGIFIDEIYSYMLSNIDDGKMVADAPQVWGQWIDAEVLKEFLTVQEGEGFAYGAVYEINSLDCHPPLYYWFMNTLCSFFPNQFNLWLGIGLNIFFYIFAAIGIYLCGRQLFHDEKLAFLPLILYGFSSMAVNSVMYIRMYMLLTVCLVWYLYVQMVLRQKGITKKTVLLNMASVFFGVFTHYYFALFAFWTTLYKCVEMLRKKKIKEMLWYGGSALCGVLLVLLVYPAMFTQITGSETNNVGNQVSENMFNMEIGLDKLSLMTETIFSCLGVFQYFIPMVAAFFAVYLLVVFLRKRAKTELLSKEYFSELLWLLTVSILTYFSITFVGGEYVYMRYYLFLMPAIFLILTILLKYLVEAVKLGKRSLIILITFLSLWSGIFNVVNLDSPYRYEERAEFTDFIRENASDYKGILISRQENVPMLQIYPALMEYREVYVAPVETVLENHVLSELLEEERGGVVMINKDLIWSEGYDAEAVMDALKEESNYSMAIYIGEIGDVEFYFVMK